MSPRLNFDKNEKVTDVEGEVAKFNNAIEASKVELTKIRNNAEVDWVNKVAIFDAHLLVLDDPELIQPIQDKIKNENANAACSINGCNNTICYNF
ncbi:phosphoenolpyruvate-utilizing N-terminal domain-containing protein [Staphylococcus aureus]